MVLRDDRVLPELLPDAELNQGLPVCHHPDAARLLWVASESSNRWVAALPRDAARNHREEDKEVFPELPAVWADPVPEDDSRLPVAWDPTSHPWDAAGTASEAQNPASQWVDPAADRDAVLPEPAADAAQAARGFRAGAAVLPVPDQASTDGASSDAAHRDEEGSLPVVAMSNPDVRYASPGMNRSRLAVSPAWDEILSLVGSQQGVAQERRAW